MKASDLLVKALENEGVEYIFGIPGEENLDFLNSLKDSTQIKLILTRHEQAAGFIPATYGRLTGRTGVCLSTLGPGATNFVTAAAYAQLGAMPMLMISGQKPIKSSKQGQFQIVDVVGLMKPLTKMSRQIINGNTIPSFVREAFRVSREERPGAVYLKLPEDIAASDASQSLFESSSVRIRHADTESLVQAVSLLREAKRPLLLIGAGVITVAHPGGPGEIIDETGIYFFGTQMGMGVVDERHGFLGTERLDSEPAASPSPWRT